MENSAKVWLDIMLMQLPESRKNLAGWQFSDAASRGGCVELVSFDDLEPNAANATSLQYSTGQ